MKRKTSTSDSSSDMVICKKMKEDVDSSDDEITIKPSRSSNPCVSKKYVFLILIPQNLIFKLIIIIIIKIVDKSIFS